MPPLSAHFVRHFPQWGKHLRRAAPGMAPPTGELSAEQTEGAEKAEVFLSAGVRSQSSLPPSKPVALPPPSSEGGNGDAAESRSEGKAIPLSPRCVRHFPRRGKHVRRAAPGMAPPTGELSAEQTEGAEKAEVFLSAGVRSQSSLPPSKPVALPPPSSEGGNGDAAESRSEGKAIPLSPRCARHFPRRGKHAGRAAREDGEGTHYSRGEGSMRKAFSTQGQRRKAPNTRSLRRTS